MGGIAFLTLMSLLICEWAFPAFLGSVVEQLIFMKMWKEERELSSFAWLVEESVGPWPVFRLLTQSTSKSTLRWEPAWVWWVSELQMRITRSVKTKHRVWYIFRQSWTDNENKHYENHSVTLLYKKNKSIQFWAKNCSQFLSLIMIAICGHWVDAILLQHYIQSLCLWDRYTTKSVSGWHFKETKKYSVA